MRLQYALPVLSVKALEQLSDLMRAASINKLSKLNYETRCWSSMCAVAR